MKRLLLNPLKPINLRSSLFLRSFINSWCLAIKDAPTPPKALLVFSQMHRQSIPLDAYSVVLTLKSCAHLHNLALINHLHAHILKLGLLDVYISTSLLHGYVVASFGHACQLFDELPQRNAVTWNTMITGYARSGNLQRARMVFEEVPRRNHGSWAAMIQAYMVGCSWDHGLVLFRQMMANESLKPDEVSVGAVLAGCSHMDAAGLPMGKSVHGFVVKKGWELDEDLGQVLIDMYAKCGYLKNAFQVFKLKPNRTAKAWTTLICGFAKHGFGKDALALFQKMQEMGVKPNEMTFTGILSGCVHAGLVEEGRKYFKMIEHYRLEPRIQHYGCMVDLFGRAGMLEEAYELIMTMKLKPNVVIWGSFLSACKEHRQFDMFERVVERVLDMIKPDTDGGVYSLICDLYALSEKWDAEERVRKLMFQKQVRKVRGSSFVKSVL